MINFDIPNISHHLNDDIQYKLDHKTKPIGSLGLLEDWAAKIARIQGRLSPVFTNPVVLTVAADHKITEEGVSPCPTEITWQQVNNFLEGGGGIGLFANLYGMDLWVADAGVDYDFKSHPKLIDVKIKKGTDNFLKGHAMTMKECKQALTNGKNIVDRFSKNGTNIIAFGEMGIGNTTPASALLSIYANISVEDSVGPGSGLNQSGINHKAKVISQAIKKHGISANPIENLARFGGLEIATIAGAMLQAASQRMCIICDGFITSSALLVAQEINPKVLDYTFFSHQSNEQGHLKMMKQMKAKAILQLELRLGEGTGAVLAYSILKGALAVLSDMTSFEEAAITDTTHIRFDK